MALYVVIVLSSACQGGQLSDRRSGVEPVGVDPIEVAYGDAPRQRLDVYAPSTAKDTPSPVLVMVHGGAWRIGDKRHGAVVNNKLSYWSARGWLFVSVNYRMLPDTDPHSQAEDVAAALAYIQQHASTWGGDPERLVAMGHSAGGHLVSLVATDPQLSAPLHGLRGSVALDTAAIDVEAILSAPHPRLYDRAFGDDPRYWRKTSPLRQLHPDVKPMLLVCSTQRENSCPHARRFAAQADKLAVTAEVLPVDLNHRELNTDLGAQSRYTEQVDRFIQGLVSRP